MALTRWMSYCVTRVMDTPFLPAEEEHLVRIELHWFKTYIDRWRWRISVGLVNCTCSCCPPDSVDVGLGKAGGVVVNDDLDSWNIQTPVGQKEPRMSNNVSPAACTTAVRLPSVEKLFEPVWRRDAAAQQSFLPGSYNIDR